MTELTPKPSQGKFVGFYLVTITLAVVIVTTIVSHTPVRLPTALVLGAIMCSTAAPVGPAQLRKPLRVLGIVLLLIAVYVLIKGK